MNTIISGWVEIVYPEGSAEKCLRIEAAGGTLHRAMITIPAVVKTGVSFAAVISLVDQNALPILSSGEVIHLAVGEGVFHDIPFPKGTCAVVRVEGLEQRELGYFRISGTVGGSRFASNPSLCADDDRPLVLWGDPHIHTTVGDCHPDRCRTRTLAYAAARHVYGLDFIAIADHVSWVPRGTPGKWKDNLALCELFNEPESFSTLYCYETSMKGGKGGDCNVYLRQPNPTYVDPWPDENLAGLCKKVEGDFFAVPHHTTRTGKHGEIPEEAYPGDELMPVVEIHSKWGTSEFRGNPTPLLSVHPGPSAVQDLLARGYRFGFVGGTDSHTSLTFCRNLEGEAHRAPPGLTAVMARKNTREEIFDAIKARRCYAACGERILLDVTCGGLPMGQVGRMPASGEVRICAEFAAESTVELVEVIRNNAVVYSENPRNWKGRIEWTDPDAGSAVPIPEFGTGRPTVFYYVRITAQADARAWSSPCWFVNALTD